MRLLLILTNVCKTPQAGIDIGFHFAEFSHAYEFFINHGCEVIIGSPLGGKCTITSDYPGDKINENFKKDSRRMQLLENTTAITELADQNFNALYVAGGHGAMFDLADNVYLSSIIQKIYIAGGIIASVCHGPAAFVGVKNADNTYLLEGKRITSFTNSEELVTPLYHDMPFLLQSVLTEQGAIFEHSDPRIPHLVVDGQIITGQNPESIELVIGAMYAQLMGKEGRYEDQHIST